MDKPASTAFSRYLSIYAALWRNSLVREMQFKLNFLLWIVVELLWFALQLTFINVIYSHTDHIGDWTKWEVILLIGTSNFIQQLFTAFFLSNLTQLSELIRTGRLDFMLLLPVNTRFLISLRQVDLGGFINACFAIAVMTYAGRQLQLSVTFLQLIGYLLLVGASLLVHYSLMVMLSASSFWTVRAQGIIWGYYNLFNIARLPDAAFRGAFKAFFTYALPMLLVANVPAKLIAQKLHSGSEMLLLVGLAAALFAVSEWVWRMSLRHYTSASS
ncbi:MAG TPA: ABC-2 family transporter protein [Verrucomicrobiae bacterium]|nr:ABC-2 family transporter protein [Verrucomicrobiae bacterium]